MSDSKFADNFTRAADAISNAAVIMKSLLAEIADPQRPPFTEDQALVLVALVAGLDQLSRISARTSERLKHVIGPQLLQYIQDVEKRKPDGSAS